MTTVPIPAPANDAGDVLRWERLDHVKRLCARYLREPDSVLDDGSTLSLVFDPDLTAEQLVLMQRVIRISGLMVITPSEWANLESSLAEMRTFRQRSQSEFMALTDNQRARAIYDGITAVTRVVHALLRD